MEDPFRPLKDAFGRFATGVTIAACADGSGGFTAITVNSFTSVSLAPPLVLWCIERKASSFNHFMAADAYSISVLTAGQKAISDRFARHEPAPLQAHEIDPGKAGAPLLKERLAGFECRVVDRPAAGDHVVLIAEVIHFDSREGAPLIYFSSRYAKGPCSS